MSRKSAKPQGQLRQSQVITTFGPGAMLDLPNRSVLVGGLDFWSQQGIEEIVEARLIEKLKALLEVSELKLYTPPAEQDEFHPSNTGIRVFQFPEWFVTQDVSREEQGGVRSRMLVHRSALTRGKFFDRDRKKQPVVPIRFVRGCRAGHIGDIDWFAFVHGEKTDCRRQLWIDETGTSGDLNEIIIRCECRQKRSLAEASGFRTVALGHCDGARPWLGPNMAEKCNEPNRLLIRTASNAYFSQLMSVISLPDRDERVKQAVDSVLEFLEAVEEIEQLKYERKKSRVKAALEDLTDDEVFAELQSRKVATPREAKKVKHAELETLLSSKEEIGYDSPEKNFYARALPREEWDRPWMESIDRVVLIHRLREVVAQVGFTRFEAAVPDIEGELEMGVRRAALSRELKWLPAIENRGEGVFLQFNTDAVEKWAQRDDVIERGRKLIAGFDRWKKDHHNSRREFPHLPYLMLHSFSHLLITAVSLECGYPASSIRERVYALRNVGYGILLYTGTTDAEGTLGGLIEVGRRIHDHVETALEIGQLCSNDPVCAQHDPQNEHEYRFLQGAACHGCLLIAETSCEQHNDFLDRSLVAPTVENLGIEFFPAAVE
jgi:hypothetical protein